MFLIFKLVYTFLSDFFHFTTGFFFSFWGEFSPVSRHPLPLISVRDQSMEKKYKILLLYGFWNPDGLPAWSGLARVIISIISILTLNYAFIIIAYYVCFIFEVRINTNTSYRKTINDLRAIKVYKIIFLYKLRWK